jgi:ParB family chromosome partitioning protein
MDKAKDILNRFGSNLAESMGAGRTPRTPAAATSPAGPSRHDGTARLKAGAEIDIDRIAPDPGQPRTEFEPGALERLAESLKTHGQLQPITVRWSESMGRYLIVAGERRWRAAALAGRKSLAAVILDGEPTESAVLEMQLIENALREDLQPIEQARAFRTLMDRNGWTAARLAEALHLTGASVSRALALLDLPYTVQDAVASGSLAPSIAYEVSKLEDPGVQREVAERIVAERMTRDDAAAAVRRATGRPSKGAKGRGATKASKITARSIRTATAKVSVELRKGSGTEAIAAAIRDALAIIEAELSAGDQAAA